MVLGSRLFRWIIAGRPVSLLQESELLFLESVTCHPHPNNEDDDHERNKDIYIDGVFDRFHKPIKKQQYITIETIS